MPINPDAVGARSEPARHRWSSKDSLLYAVGVGAGAVDPLDELEFTTEPRRMKLFDVRPLHDTFGLSEPRLIAPGRPESSVLSTASPTGTRATCCRCDAGGRPQGGEMLRQWVRRMPAEQR